jgi:acetyltransferase-like isoleucine patch superfamily enzyme
MSNRIYRSLVNRSSTLGNLLWQLLGGDLRRKVQGRDNLVDLDRARLVNVELDIVGDGNQVIAAEGVQLCGLRIRMRGSGHRLVFGRDSRVSRGGVFWFEDKGGRLEIGAKTTIVEAHIVVDEPGSQVTIGEDCMFANDIEIRCSDSHAILDAGTGERINPARNVAVGDHVWIAAHAILLKGVEIGHDSIIAAGAVVTKSCGPGVILAGNPAAVIKEGVAWRRERNPRNNP